MESLARSLEHRFTLRAGGVRRPHAEKKPKKYQKA
jgi:hypothetical protein